MKIMIISVMLCLLVTACSRVTTKPDTNTTTSGTLGSVKATNQLPKDPVDTTLKPEDTIKIVRDSVP
jgi:PBP1b-binding outer membrane lipoprotein LpoB